MVTIPLQTQQQQEWIEVTAQVQAAVDHAGIREGLVVAHVLHTTAGLTINENADPDVVTDLRHQLDRLAPQDGAYRHREGNSAAHMKSTLVGNSVTVPVSNGRLALGTWQGIYFCEFDGPRHRTMVVQALG